MSNFSEDDIRHAAEVREWLMKQISDKQEQIDKMSTILRLIDSLLKQSSFKPASSIASSSPSSSPSSVSFTSQTSQSTINAQGMSSYSGSQSNRITGVNSPAATMEAKASESQKIPSEVGEYDKQVKPLKRLKDDFLIANAKILHNSVEIIPAKGIALNVNTPPFRSFFLNRILEGMKIKDTEKVSQNQIDESTSLDYNVEEDENGIIKKIIINNYRDKDRLNEIFNTSTWVFTRMIEKTNRA
jgi:hypothetical protein